MLLDSPLNGLTILAVDDEQDILDVIEDELDMCIVHKAADYETALQYLLGYTYDIVILDIMGVNGFELLRTSVSQGFPTLMFTAYALTIDDLKKSIKLGAVFFLPKDKLPEIRDFLERLIKHDLKANWMDFFDRMGIYFSKHLGPDWKEKDKFFQEFEETLTKGYKTTSH